MPELAKVAMVLADGSASQSGAKRENKLTKRALTPKRVCCFGPVYIPCYTGEARTAE